jgi:hypothetical protein
MFVALMPVHIFFYIVKCCCILFCEYESFKNLNLIQIQINLLL